MRSGHLLRAWHQLILPQPYARTTIAVADFHKLYRARAATQAVGNSVGSEFLCQHAFSIGLDGATPSSQLKENCNCRPPGGRIATVQVTDRCEKGGKILVHGHCWDFAIQRGYRR